MSYVQRINPFAGILCVPYYYIWIAVVVSYILTIFNILYLYLINKYAMRVLANRQDNLEIIIDQRIMESTQSALKKMKFYGEALPTKIIIAILEMMPDFDSDSNYYQSKFQQIDIQMAVVHATLYIYPIIRFIINLMNFSLVIIRYTGWYNDNEELSGWDKYCALIIAWFYLPNWRGHGINTIWQVIGGEILKQNIDGLFNFSALIFGVFLTAFIIISFPIFISGLFVYITSTLMIGIIGGSFAMVVYIGFTLFSSKYTNLRKSDYRFYGFTAGSVFSVSFLGMWLMIMTIVCSMELYAGSSWMDAYEIGFTGAYCDGEDYLSWNKWDQYDWETQLLIISWFLF